jgi:membrane associated rhomboid family serine protease
MSIYNRPYMRAESGGGGFGGEGQVIKRLIILMVSVYVVQNIFVFWVGTLAFERAFSLSLENLGRGYLHTLVTYGFLHGGLGAMPWHLLFNCLLLFLFGRVVQATLGERRLTEAFMLGIFGGGIAWLLVRFINPGGNLVGASGGVYTIIAIGLFQFWRQPVQLWLLPFVVEGRHLFYFFAGLSAFLFIFGELDGATNAAHSAHLGGLLVGWLYARYLAHRPALTDISFWAKTTRQEPPWERKRAAVQARGGGRFKVNVRPAPSKNLRAEVDRILDKINEQGFGALTEEEKRTLDRAKEDLR